MAVVLSKGILGVAWYDSICSEVTCHSSLAVRNTPRPRKPVLRRFCTPALQLYVLQAQEESLGSFAFQLLKLARLHAAPTVPCLCSALQAVHQDPKTGND